MPLWEDGKKREQEKEERTRKKSWNLDKVNGTFKYFFLCQRAKREGSLRCCICLFVS